MAMHSTDTEWGGLTKLFHWLLFLVVVATFFAVSVAQSYERETAERAWWMVLHRSFGVTAMTLMVVWLLARVRAGRPSPYGALWQIRLSRLTHWGMICLVIAMPVAGLLMSQFGGRTVVIFHLFSIPPLLPENEALAKQIYDLHTNIGAPLFAALILLHIAGSLWHHFIDKDGTLRRMLPGGEATPDRTRAD